MRNRSKKELGFGHWLDDTGEYDKQITKIEEKNLSPTKEAAEKTKFERKYIAKNTVGDICEVREDGWWDWLMKKNPKNRMQEVFGIIQVNAALPKWLENRSNIDARRYNVENGVTLGEVTIVEPAQLRIRDKQTLILHTGVLWLNLRPQ